MKFDRKKFLSNIMYVLLFFSGVVIIYHYICNSTGIMPIMDYWIDSGVYLRKIMNNDYGLSDIITIPHQLHWNPLYNFFNIFFVKIFKCNNEAYIFGGMIVHSLIMIIILIFFNKKISNNNCMFNILGIVVCLLSIINLNQWEIMTLYCYFIFMVRIFLYLLMFYYLDIYVDKKTKKIGSSFLIGIINICIILLASQAYFFGFIVAQIAIFIIVILVKKRKEDILNYSIIITCNILAVITYIITLESIHSSIKDGYDGLFQIIIKYIKGMFLMLGAIIVPIEKIQNNILSCYFVGFCIFIVSIIAVVCFFAFKIYEKTYFPLACIIYAYVTIVTIIYGRADIFGLESVVASRYVVETTIGMLGILQILLIVLSNINGFKKTKIVIGCFCVMTLATLIWADKEEIKVGRYRKSYNDSIVELALDVDNATDEELGIFQASADDVREGISAMKDYKLNVFGYEVGLEYTEMIGDEIIRYKGMYDDGWVEKDCSFKILLDEGEDIKVDYQCFEEQKVKVLIDGEQVQTVDLKPDDHDFIIDCTGEGWKSIELISDYDKMLDGPDTRVCSYILNDFDRLSY